MASIVSLSSVPTIISKTLTNPSTTRSQTNRVFTRPQTLALHLSKSGIKGSYWLRSDSDSAALLAFDGGSGGGGIGDGGGDGGGDGSESGNPKVGGAAVDDVSALSPDVILLSVGGMTCGGCAASVKRILESQPQVSSASVDLATETASVWAVSEAKVVPNWRQELGEILAKHLTTCGFQSKLKDEEVKEGGVPV